MDSADDIVVDNVEFVSRRNSSSYGTLPKVMRKNISRQIVPAMKKMFEKKARSVEPSGSEIRLKIQTATPSRVRRSLSPAVTSPEPRKDEATTEESGTESVSSFVAVSVDRTSEDKSAKCEAAKSPSVAAQESEDPDDDASSWSACSLERRNSSAADSSTAGGSVKKGFVNKYVSKVKNIIHSKGESDA